MLKRMGAFTLVLTAFACSGSNTTTPTPTRANITVTVSPNPVASTVCSPTPCPSPDGRQFQWRVQGAITIQETTGLAGTINSITDTSFNPPLVFSSDIITQRSGTSRVPARGMLIFPLDIIYGLVGNPNATRQHVFAFTVQFTDDSGNQLTGVAQWSAN
jgi:hypothetical protein